MEFFKNRGLLRKEARERALMLRKKTKYPVSNTVEMGYF